MPRSCNAVLMASLLGLFSADPGFAQDLLYVPPAPDSAPLAPPVSVGPYNVYDEPVFLAPLYVAPVSLSPVYVQPVVPAPVVVTDWYAPSYAAPGRVTVWSSPWSYKSEYEYWTPFGAHEVEYRVDRYGRVRIEYDD